MLKPSSIPFQYGNFTVAADVYSTSAKLSHSAPHLTILHGAGTATRERYAAFRESLLGYGISSSALDFIGHGESSGTLSDSSLFERTKQAAALIKKTEVSAPLCLFGASMGAYNAIKLTELYDVSALILFVPGIYTPLAYTTPFGPDFSAIIRRERSWVDTDAWEILSRFKGSLLVVAAEEDAVIPMEIPERLIASAVQARSKRLLVVPGAPHQLMNYLHKSPERYEELVQRIREIVIL